MKLHGEVTLRTRPTLGAAVLESRTADSKGNRIRENGVMKKQDPAGKQDPNVRREIGRERFMHLDALQTRAVTWGDGPCLTLAGPGAGKTTVLTERILYLIREAGIPEDQILVITFTRDAAMEMKTRFLEKSGKTGQSVSFGTFHSVFFFILRTSLGYRQKDLLTGSKKRALLKASLIESGLPFLEDAEEDPKVWQELSRFACSGLSLDSYEPKFFSADFRRVIGLYQEKKKECHLLDFDDLMGKTRELFLTRPDILKQWRKRYQYLLVDEVQDMNPIQFEILALLSSPGNHIFAVGDDDQSIYGFRNASPKLMLRFPEIYPNCEILRMTRNYRSAKAIVRASDHLIQWNKERYPKEAEAVSEEEGSILYIESGSPEEEAEKIVQMIEKDLEGSGRIGVLFRNRFHSNAIRQELALHRIAFSYPEEKKNPYHHTIFRDMESYLRLADGKRRREDFFRIINKPLRYLPRTIFSEDGLSDQELLNRARAYGSGRFADASGNADLYARRQGAERFYQILYGLLQDLHFIRTLPPYAAVNYILKGCGYETYLRENARENGWMTERSRNHMQGRSRQQTESDQKWQKNESRAGGVYSLEKDMVDQKETEVWEAHRDFILRLARQEHSIRGLASRLQDLREEWNREAESRNQSREDRNPSDQACRLSLHTFHSSKGLEFDTVYILNLVEGAVPSAKAVTEAEMEEERRMFYVAVTRAKMKLILSSSNDSKKMRTPSRFLREMHSRRDEYNLSDDC